ncbi:hypothetical protein C8A03DRAFT_12882 [Achaetomium macrosporum]|uniref:Uncharacterized protein n=1 Tax=Achaetomium macrosporum TaxID=79813 RepID=A0AAN7CEW2_9PEZI|nr:hypothetical protein C8A03DRAFT_12882 [Achaetomium macrosporum]
MLSKKQRTQTLSLAENVALLSLLCGAPTAPNTNPWPTAVDNHSFADEVRLTSTIAYLSGISDDPSHVVAVCVEGLTSGREIRVVIAVNKEHPVSGNDVLARIKNGLDEVFGHLARANREQDAVLEDSVLHAIVKMCKHRIFSRIKSKRSDATYSKRKGGTAFLGSPLQRVIDAVRKYGNRKRSGAEVERFTRDAVRFRDRLETLETCQEKDVVSHITGVLRAAHRLNETTDFDNILQGLGSRELNSTTRTGLATRLGKLANYVECSLYLCRKAKESGIFRDAEVITISLDANLFARSLEVPPECCLRSCLGRCENGAPTVFGAKNIDSRLKELGRDNTVFLSTVRKILRESRVHAEVQIVCYYELRPIASKPRVICSSKDACYLCNLFIRLHGTFYIPKTHGNLYPGWRLLPIPSLNRAQAQLNRSLEAQIREITGVLMSNPHQHLMLSPNENESTVSLPVSPTAILEPETIQRPGPGSLTTPEQSPKPEVKPEPEHEPQTTLEQDPKPEPEPEPTSKPGRVLEPIPELEAEPEPEPDSVPGPVHKPEPEPVPSQSPTRNPTPTPSPSPKEPPPQLLTRGHVLIYRLDTAKPIPAFTTGLMTMHPEFIRTLATPRSRFAEVHIQWLPRRHAAAFYTARPSGFVELESVGRGVDVDCGTSECVYLAYAGEVVILDFLRELV